MHTIGLVARPAGPLLWAALSLVGWAVGFAAVFIGGWFAVEAITGDADRVLAEGTGFSLSLLIGFILSGAGWAAGQWLLLRRHLTGASRWILGGALGFGVVAAVNLLLHDRVPLVLNELVHNIAGGLVMGLIQLPVLRQLNDRQLDSRKRSWPTVTAIAMLAAAAISAAVQLAGDTGGDLGGLAGVTGAALVTGLALRQQTKAPAQLVPLNRP